MAVPGLFWPLSLLQGMGPASDSLAAGFVCFTGIAGSTWVRLHWGEHPSPQWYLSGLSEALRPQGGSWSKICSFLPVKVTCYVMPCTLPVESALGGPEVSSVGGFVCAGILGMCITRFLQMDLVSPSFLVS